MHKKIAGFLGAVTAAATMGGAQASTAPALTEDGPLAARSYSDLLTPIPNATEALAADDAARAQAAKGVQLAQYHHHHHQHYHHHHHQHYHHHHHRVIVVPRSRYHHHHQHGAFIGVPGVGRV